MNTKLSYVKISLIFIGLFFLITEPSISQEEGPYGPYSTPTALDPWCFYPGEIYCKPSMEEVVSYMAANDSRCKDGTSLSTYPTFNVSCAQSPNVPLPSVYLVVTGTQILGQDNNGDDIHYPLNTKIQGSLAQIYNVPVCPEDYPAGWVNPDDEEDERCYPSQCSFQSSLLGYIESTFDVPHKSCMPLGETMTCEYENKASSCDDNAGCQVYFQPTGYETQECGDPINVIEENPDDPNCKNIADDMKICKANPDDVCETDQYGNQTCKDGCGIIYDDFVCIEDNNEEPPDGPTDDVENHETKEAQEETGDTDAERNKLLNDIVHNTSETVKAIDDLIEAQHDRGEVQDKQQKKQQETLDKIADELTKEKTKYEYKPEKGSFEETIKAYQEKVLQEKQTFKDDLARIKTEASNVLGNVNTGAASLPCWNYNAAGVQETVCLSTYHDQLSIIAQALGALFMIIAAFILFR